MSEPDARRPIAARNTGWAASISRLLVKLKISPNQISVASMVFALLAAGLYGASYGRTGGQIIILILAGALAVQGRLLCNLFDGMVAIEGGKAAPDGPFWNEAPDRVADILIFTGFGYAAGDMTLGWAVACFSVGTAYIRELGRAVGAPADYSGPLAKQHRMAIVTLASLGACLEPLWSQQGQVLKIALWILVVGTAFTGMRRAVRLVGYLRSSEE